MGLGGWAKNFTNFLATALVAANQHLSFCEHAQNVDLGIVVVFDLSFQCFFRIQKTFNQLQTYTNQQRLKVDYLES